MRKRKKNSRMLAIVLCILMVVLITIVALRIAFHGKTQVAILPEPAESGITAEPSVTEPEPKEKAPTEKEPLVIPLEEIQPEASEEELLPEEPPEPVQNSRYADVAMSDAERELMAKVIYLEAGNQSAEGQQAVAEVIFNRVIHSTFPNNVTDVLWQKDQFSVMPNLSCATPGQVQYDAIDGALYGELILDEDVVFFSREAQNDRIWGRIEDHVFCYSYIWG